MTLPDYDYYRSIFAGQQMPFAFVDLDMLNQNIQKVIQRSGGKSVRVATKSVRCRHLLTHILNTTGPFQGLMCFSVREALWLCESGFDDLLLGYPAWHIEQLVQVGKKIKEGKTIILMADLPEHLDHLNAIGKKQEVVFPICLDLDMSTRFPGIWFGVRRSSVRSVAEASAFISKVKECSNLRLVGLMGYEAQIAGVADALHGRWLMNKLFRLMKHRSINEISSKRSEVVDLIKNAGIDLLFVNGGGTGSLESTRLEGAVSEVTVGSAFYSSHLFDHYRHFRHLPAAAYAIEVVRKPEKHVYTCLGGGYVASGTPGTEKAPALYLPKGAQLLKHEMAGEVQTPVWYKGKVNLNLGDPVFLRHSKAGELCEHFNRILLVSNGKIVNTVPTYRGEGHAFL